MSEALRVVAALIVISCMAVAEPQAWVLKVNFVLQIS